jgi:hypothetical protein
MKNLKIFLDTIRPEVVHFWRLEAVFLCVLQRRKRINYFAETGVKPVEGVRDLY